MLKYHKKKVVGFEEDGDRGKLEIKQTPEEEALMILDYINVQQNSKYFSALDKCCLYGLFYANMSNE